jgi:hypothetical protein
LTKPTKKGSLLLESKQSHLPKRESLMIMLQRVIKLLEKVNPQIRAYVVCLMLTAGRKTCAEMARTLGISEKRLYAFLAAGKDNSKEIEDHLIEFAKSTRDKNIKRTLIVDPTAMIKPTFRKLTNKRSSRLFRGLTNIVSSIGCQVIL